MQVHYNILEYPELRHDLKIIAQKARDLWRDTPKPDYLCSHLEGMSERDHVPLRNIAEFSARRMYITVEFCIPVFAAVDLDERITDCVRSENNFNLSCCTQPLHDFNDECPMLWLFESTELVYMQPMKPSMMASTLTALHEFNLVCKSNLLTSSIILAVEHNYDHFDDPE